MKCKKAICMVLLIGILVLLAGCSHTHEWNPATCESPEICSECGETNAESAALGHSWVDATCELPRTCSVCNKTEGQALGHKWEDATCDIPRTCSVCHKTDGEPLGHAWIEATCQTPATCSVCGHQPDEKLGNHTVNVWDETIDSTCTEVGSRTGKCAVCATECTEEIPLKEHTLDEWVVASEPVYGTAGINEQLCSVCNQVINTQEVQYSEFISGRYKLIGETKGFEITDCEFWYVQDGTYSGDYIDGLAVVEVVNTGTHNLFLKECVFEFEDDLGQFIGNGGIADTISVPSVIMPGETGYFICEIICPMEELDTSNGIHAIARIDLKQTEKEPTYFEVEYRVAGLNISGTVHNTSEESSNDWLFIILYKNDRGQVVECAREYFWGEELGVDEYRTISVSPYAIDPKIERLIASETVLAWVDIDEP